MKCQSNSSKRRNRSPSVKSPYENEKSKEGRKEGKRNRVGKVWHAGIEWNWWKMPCWKLVGMGPNPSRNRNGLGLIEDEGKSFTSSGREREREWYWKDLCLLDFIRIELRNSRVDLCFLLITSLCHCLLILHEITLSSNAKTW